MMDPIHVFVSYSHEDSRWLDRENEYCLIPRLERSLRQDGVEFWYDPSLVPGDEFTREILKQIDAADVAILLVSQGFLDSDYIMRKVELPRIAERANAAELVVVPILVGPCDWKEVNLIASIHMLPSKTTPLINYVGKEAEFANIRYEILQGIRECVRKIRQQRTIGHRGSGEELPIIIGPQTPDKTRKSILRWAFTATAACVVIAALFLILWGGHKSSSPPSSPKLPVAPETKEPAPQPEGVATTQTRQTPVLLVEGFSNSNSQISSMAFADEGVIVKSTGANSFSYNPAHQASAAIIQTVFRSGKTLEDLRRFVEQGGRAVMLVCSQYSEQNGDLQEFFGISVARQQKIIGMPDSTEDATLVGKTTQLAGGESCPLFNDLTLGGGTVTWFQTIAGRKFYGGSAINCYLVPVGQEWVTSHLSSDPKLCLSAWKKLGKGEVLFLVCFDRDSSSFPKSFFDDGLIEVEQNQEAARRLIRWLARKSEYPTSASPARETPVPSKSVSTAKSQVFRASDAALVVAGMYIGQCALRGGKVSDAARDNIERHLRVGGIADEAIRKATALLATVQGQSGISGGIDKVGEMVADLSNAAQQVNPAIGQEAIKFGFNFGIIVMRVNAAVDMPSLSPDQSAAVLANLQTVFKMPSFATAATVQSQIPFPARMKDALDHMFAQDTSKLEGCQLAARDAALFSFLLWRIAEEGPNSLDSVRGTPDSECASRMSIRLERDGFAVSLPGVPSKTTLFERN